MEVLTRRRPKRNAASYTSDDNEDETEATEQEEAANVETNHEDEISPVEDSQPTLEENSSRHLPMMI